MKRISGGMMTLLLVASVMCAADDVQTAKVLGVKAYDQGRIAYWEGRVPIYDGYPFYDITLSLGSKKYVVRYESMTGYYPSSWKVGSDIRVRAPGKGKMYLVNQGQEVLTSIFNARAADCVLPSGPPGMLTAGPQVPCE